MSNFPASMTLPRISGISRDAESPGQAGLLIFPERRLTDEEMRWLHDYLNDVDCRSVFDVRRRMSARDDTRKMSANPNF